MWGCDRLGYPVLYGNSQFAANQMSCDSSKAYGWWAAVYFVIVVIFGGLVLPTVLIGIM